jgi:hypothetical protein
MFKLKTLLLIGVIVAVAACGGQAPTAPAAPPTAVATVPPTATTAAAATPTQASSGLAVTPASVASAPKLDPAGMCKATSAPQPVPNFPATTPADHSRGPDSAPITMYEYSDFQ